MSARFFRIWATVWATLLGLLFVTVTALALATWFADPDRAETNPVVDLAFFALGMAIAAGLASQVRSPGRNVAGLHQAVVASACLALAGAAGGRGEPLVGGIALLVVGAVLVALHPSRARLLQLADRPAPSILVLGLAAAGPAAAYAVSMVGSARDAGPSCFLGQCATGDRFAEMAATALVVVLLAVLGALKPSGWGLPLWTSAGVAALVGAASVGLPDVPGSLGAGWGIATVAWGVVLAVAGEHRRRARPTTHDDPQHDHVPDLVSTSRRS